MNATLTTDAAKLCGIALAAGRRERCPASCPFWEPGGAVLDPSCMLERMLDPADWSPELAARWLRLRDRPAMNDR